MDPNSWVEFLILFCSSKRGPQKNSPLRNSPREIHLPKFIPEIGPKTHIPPLQAHLADFVSGTKKQPKRKFSGRISCEHSVVMRADVHGWWVRISIDPNTLTSQKVFFQKNFGSLDSLRPPCGGKLGSA